jgi:V-type H+-transporting ATPase subunit a
MSKWHASNINVTGNDNLGIVPPTFNKHTDISAVFQLIIDTYGVPSYKEANPNPIQMVTFPFMFGMMFGDTGHGSILLIFGLILTF